MAVFFVRPTGLRPDFRLVLTFLWGDQRDCDTDGNSHNPASREWTELYCCNRDNPTEAFNVSPYSRQPLLLEVESPLDYLAARVTFFLATESEGRVAEQPDGSFGPPETLTARMGDFDLDAAKERVRRSSFQGATLDDPYPNLRRRRQKGPG